MAVPTSATTDEELWALYDDAAGYSITGSVTQAQEFIVACRIIKRRRPDSVSGDGQSAKFNNIDDELAKAERWLAGRNSVGSRGPRLIDYRGSRI
jgi:hypothetical protein